MSLADKHLGGVPSIFFVPSFKLNQLQTGIQQHAYTFLFYLLK